MRHMCNLESVYTYEGTHDIHTLAIGAGADGHRGVPVANVPWRGSGDRDRRMTTGIPHQPLGALFLRFLRFGLWPGADPWRRSA